MINELNSIQNTMPNATRVTKGSPVSEVFNAWVGNGDFSRFDPKIVKASQDHIKAIAGQAAAGNGEAVNEINTLRTIAIEERLLQQIPNLAVFGSYQSFGVNETIEREIVVYSGERSRFQAAGGDPVFPVREIKRRIVPTKTITGGYVVDYRRMELGDMSVESKGIQEVVTDMMNRIVLEIIKQTYTTVKDYNGVKRYAEFNGITQAAVDKIINKIRRDGKPTLLADVAILDQFAGFAGYRAEMPALTSSGTAATFVGASDALMDEVRYNGHPAVYHGCNLVELPNPYDYSRLNADGDDYATYLPLGLGIMTAAGQNSPIWVGTRGGLTSLQGVNVKTGNIETRYDIEVAIDVAPELLDKIAIIYDLDLGGLE